MLSNNLEFNNTIPIALKKKKKKKKKRTDGSCKLIAFARNRRAACIIYDEDADAAARALRERDSNRCVVISETISRVSLHRTSPMALSSSVNLAGIYIHTYVRMYIYDASGRVATARVFFPLFFQTGPEENGELG